MVKERQTARQQFLDACDLQSSTIEPLAQDASFRRYFRIHSENQTYILMDAPPAKEKIRPFITIAKHLSRLSLRAPEIIEFDLDTGFILLEDFGDDTFTRLLANDQDESVLYNLAVDTLISLHKHPHATNLKLPAYDSETLINEALLLCDWYYSKRSGDPISITSRNSYIDCWHSILSSLPTLKSSLVLRDYHVDNLIRLNDGQCGLLDFQDALIGNAAYDLVSLLEDARRDIRPELQSQILKRYFQAFKQVNSAHFMRWYTVLGAQRHCKVLGIFTRLSVRDDKHHYLKHLPRVENLLVSHLDEKDLLPLKYWLEQHGLQPG